MMIAAQNYLDSARAEFLKLRALAEKSFEQLEESDFHFRPDAESNSIAVLIQHMSGNMISRWTDFLTSDGEKPDRHRDSEFEEQAQTREQLMKQWQRGWQVFTDTMNSLTAEDMLREVTIRGEKHSAIQAINRQLTHYGYHVGQIVFLAKHIRAEGWKTLSIARHKSAEFNQQMSQRQGESQ
jgi:Protein of unknown function (DUF1572)